MPVKWLWLKTLSGVFLVFLLGGVTGAGLTRAWDERKLLSAPLDPGVGPSDTQWPVIMWALDRKLHLSEDQHTQVSGILKEFAGKLSTTLRELAPKLRALRASFKERMHGVLDETQRSDFDALMKDFEARQDRLLGPPAPGEGATQP